MLGHDWSVTLSITSRELQQDRERYNPDGYLFITRNVLPMLKELGVADEAVRQVMVEKPATLLRGQLAKST